MIYSKATEETRWQDDAKLSCAAMVAVRGGAGRVESMTVSERGRLGGLPQYRVDGGTLQGEPVYCWNFVGGDDKKVTASHLFLTADGTPLG